MRDQRRDESSSVDSHRKRDVQRGIISFYYLILFFVFAFSPDLMAAVTIFPVWSWCVLGWILSISYPLKKWFKNLQVALGLTLLNVLIVAEEPYILMRTLFDQSPKSQVHLVSLNCGGGIEEAAEEALDLGSEFVLLQESPPATQLVPLGERLGYHVFAGIDASILIKKELVEFESVSVIREPDFTLVRTPYSVIVSLRLAPPIFRLDYWTPECWTSQAELLKRRKMRTEEILRIVDKERKLIKFEGPVDVLVGGDYNAPPAQLGSKQFMNVRDSGEVRGFGWPGTAINDLPLVRIDRIWTVGMNDSKMGNWQVSSRKTRHSDHRMVIVKK
ncbi:hypothetical protein CCB80_06110 [Armatimonadetes bacterium Uphvl-Ar1]|nr:hypothetical protein CCB80_06110 [Armatimonadetes bacterium Uphvl-Ar1]